MSVRRIPVSILALTLAGWVSAQGLPEGPHVCPNTHSIMHFSEDWMRQHHRMRASLPVVHAPGLPTGSTSLDLTRFVDFAACGGARGFNQGACGNCWVFGTTLALSVDDGVASGTPQLFSTQWFDSDYYATGNGSTCNGGSDQELTNWYNGHPKFIPWSNAGAGYADGNGPSVPATPVSSISQTPSVGVSRISVSQIATSRVSQAQAIANIKSVLDNNQAVVMAFFLPQAGWTDFFNSWDRDAETTPWSGVDKYSGQGQNGGHLVCVVGYDDALGIWRIQNSWGTTSGRPHGWFALPQAMNYADSVGGYDQWEFDAITPVGWTNAGASAPVITAQPLGQSAALGATATFKVVATGSAPLTYQWFKGTSAIPGATASTYTTPPVTAADNGTTFHVTVSNANGTVTSANATLTVGTGPVGGDLIQNGGFEAGGQGWKGSSGVIGRFGTAAPPYAGQGNAWFSRNTLSWSRKGSLSQVVTVPATAAQATLAFQLHVNAGSGGSLAVQVLDANGQVLATLGSFGDAAAATGYQAHSYDLTAYKGKAVQITFSANLGWARRNPAGTSFTLDNVSLVTH